MSGAMAVSGTSDWPNHENVQISKAEVLPTPPGDTYVNTE